MGRSRDLMTWLKENKLDLVYYSSERTTDPELTCGYCREERLAFRAPPESPLAVQKRVSLADFLNQPLLVTERSGVCYRRLKALAEAEGLSVHHAVEVDNTKAIADLVAQGMGCAFLPGYSVMKDVQAGRLAELAVDTEPQTYYSQIVCHRNKWVPPYQAGLVELIQQARPE